MIGLDSAVPHPTAGRGVHEFAGYHGPKIEGCWRRFPWREAEATA